MESKLESKSEMGGNVRWEEESTDTVITKQIDILDEELFLYHAT